MIHQHISINLTHLQTNGYNPRTKDERSFDDPALQELCDSIKSMGLLQPLVVRPIDSTPSYEIVCGERRFLCLTKLGISEAPCVVMQADDGNAVSMCIAENLNRSDVDPWEEVAALAVLADKGFTQQDIADTLGKPVSWVAQRMQLSSLTKKEMKEISQKCPLWNIGHYQLIARLPKEERAEIIDTMGWCFEDYTVNDLSRYLLNDKRYIKAFKWDLDATDLAGKPSCNACTQRTSCQANLFPELNDEAKDRCLNSVCHSAKDKAYLQARIETLKEQHPKLVLFTSSHNANIEVPNVRNNQSHYVCKKSDKGSVPAIELSGPAAGKKIWVKPQSFSRSSSNENTGKPVTLVQKRANLESRRRFRTIKVFHDILTKMLFDNVEEAYPSNARYVLEEKHQTKTIKGALPTVDQLCQLIAVFGGHQYFDNWDLKDLSKKKFNALLPSDAGTVQKRLATVILPKICSFIKSEVESKRIPKILDFLASTFSIDLSEIEAFVKDTMQEPKAWAKLAA